MSEIPRWGASPDEWVLFNKTLGLSDYLLPVVANPHASISPDSKVTTMGKLPSLYDSRRKVCGIKGWTNKSATPGELVKWQNEPDYSLCVRGVGCNAFDVDIEDKELSYKVKQFLQGPAQMNGLPTRFREDSSKFLMPFKLPISTGNGKRIIKCDHGIIEWLATGQQWVAAGTHTGGKRYQWESGYPSDEIDIPTLTMTQAEAVWDLLEAEFATEPSAPAKLPRASKMEAIHNTDPLLNTLRERNMVLDTESDGRVHITCPFEHEHSSQGSITSTTYFPAHTNGYDEPSIYCLHAHCSERHTEDYLMELGLVANDFEPVVPTTTLPAVVGDTFSLDDLIPPRRKSRFNLEPAHNFAAKGFLIPWHIKGILPKSQVGMIIGPPGGGKTFMVLDLMYAIATGENWRGFPVKQGGVVYFAVEGKDGIRARIKAYEVDRGIDESNSPPLYITPQNVNLSKRDDVLDIIESINNIGGIKIVVFDTLSSASPGANENAAEDMSLLLSNCRYINEKTDATVLLVHHTGKDQDRGARGSSALLGAADFQLQIVRNADLRSIVVNKLRDGGESQELGFRLKMVPIGFDEDDAMVESCVIAHTEDMPLKMPDKVGKMELRVVKFLKRMYKRDEFYPDRNSLVDFMVNEGKLKRSNVDRALNAALKKDMVRSLEGMITDVQPEEIKR